MDKRTEERIRSLVDKFSLLRTKEGSNEFEVEWADLMSSIPDEDKLSAGKILRDEMTSRRSKEANTAVKSVLGSLCEVLNMSYIAREYFHKDKSWLSQRINGNIVNGKVSAFTDAEIDILRSALDDIKNRLSETISNI